jgi:hypothetical protein
MAVVRAGVAAQLGDPLSVPTARFIYFNDFSSFSSNRYDDSKTSFSFTYCKFSVIAENNNL